MDLNDKTIGLLQTYISSVSYNVLEGRTGWSLARFSGRRKNNSIKGGFEESKIEQGKRKATHGK